MRYLAAAVGLQLLLLALVLLLGSCGETAAACRAKGGRWVAFGYHSWSVSGRVLVLTFIRLHRCEVP